jgi:hypothetical protein
MKKKFISILFIVASIFKIQAYNEDPFPILDSIQKSIRQFNERFPQEKVYLHLDNSYYQAGDTLWFKSYVLNVDNFTPTKISKVLYVELISETRKIFYRNFYKIENGSASGFLPLNTDFKAGNYMIRAYTRHMLNVSDENYFTRIFTLYSNHFNKKHLIPNKKDTCIQLRFFPEGGNWVSGLPSRTAVEALSAGKPVGGTGRIVDAEDNTLVDFHIPATGRNDFVFTPETGKSYKAFLFVKEDTLDFPLPVIKEEGITADVTEDSLSFKIKIHRSQAFTQKPVFYLLQNRNRVLQSGSLTDQLKLEKQKLPSGVSQLTLFTMEGLPLWERLLFVDHNDRLNIEIKQQKKNYLPREKIELQIKVSDSSGRPVQANLSIAVTDSATTNIAPNMVANLLLEAELNGRIDPLLDYMKDENRKERDLLLLTRGWRNYTFKQQTGRDALSANHAAEKGIFFHGRLLEKKPDEWMVEATLFVNKSPVALLGDFKPDASGYFSFNTHFEGTADIILVAKKKGKKKKSRIEIGNRWFPPSVLIEPFDVDSFLDEEMRQFVEELALDTTVFMSLLLNEVEITEKNKDRPRSLMEFKQTTDILRGYGKEFVNVLGLLAELRPCLEVCHTESGGYRLDEQCAECVTMHLHPSHDILGFGQIAVNDCDTTLFSLKYVALPSFIQVENIAESPGFDKSNPWTYIRNIEFEKISALILSHGTYIPPKKNISRPSVTVINSNLCDGKDHVSINIIISEKTKKSKYEHTYIRGYSLQKEFYSPNYENQESVGEDPDLRHTLYWNASLKTDNGESTLVFYNNDKHTNLNITVEGISYAGEIGSKRIKND